MEHEEREEIPWSSLMPQGEPGVDRRWYAVGVTVAALILAVLGWRLVSSHGVPDPDGVAMPPSVSTITTTTTAPAELIVAESSLVRTQTDLGSRAEIARAEWFVTDFFTRDGGATAEGIARAVVPELAPTVLAAFEGETETETFVEWSRVSMVEATSDDEVIVIVAYRAIAATPDGYDRLPVAFVALGIRTVDGVPLVSSLPVEVPAWSAPS